MILIVTLVPTIVTWGVFAAIWQFVGKARPILAGSVILLTGLVAVLLFLAFFDVFFLLGMGIIVLVPATVVGIIAVCYFVTGLRNGRGSAIASFHGAKRVLRDVYDGTHC